ncbi:MAG: UDP-N-acetylmuramate--L-alanine ligase [Spirochaetaceae bacterium]
MPLSGSLEGAQIHLVGVKGTGMAALAEVLVSKGAVVSGSDVGETFYTDALLAAVGIVPRVGFAEEHLPDGVSLVVYSAAYDPETNPELRAAIDRGIPLLTYTEALGALSLEAREAGAPTVAVAGVHGKTSTTALLGTLLRSLRIPGTVIVGSAVKSFGGAASYNGGSEALVAETCEYRRNFLSFYPSVLVVTAVEADHLDYYRDYADVLSAFVAFGERLAPGGLLVYCRDNAGACEAAAAICGRRGDLRTVSYGFSDEADVPVRDYLLGTEETPEGPRRVQEFRIDGIDTLLKLRVPGKHMVENAAAALTVLREEPVFRRYLDAAGTEIALALASFSGTTRRSEHLGTAGGIQFVDDYGHHPTAIRKTLETYREFYGAERLIVDFMSHTYSRTAALLDDFARAFAAADVVILHKIYASAREQFSGSVSGEDLAAAVGAYHPQVHYFEEVLDALPYCKGLLRPGDLFVTLGAGNNWVLGRELLSYFSKKAVHTR